MRTVVEPHTAAEPAGAPEAERPLGARARLAVLAMHAGLATTALAMTALVVDLQSTGVLDAHLHEVYDGHAVDPPPPGAVAAYLFTVGALGIVGWMSTAWAVRRRKRWARPLASVVLVLAGVVALANLSVTEYDRTILPIQIGLVGLLPVLAGIVAVALLWTDRER